MAKTKIKNVSPSRKLNKKELTQVKGGLLPLKMIASRNKCTAMMTCGESLVKRTSRL